MTREEVSEKIKKIIFDSVPDRVPEVIADDTVVNNDMAIDSMGFILVICRCEAELGVKIPERKWQKLSTFGEVVDEFMLQLKKANK
jgi:acyl carrier protein